VAQAIRARSLQPQPILIAVTAHTIDQMHGRAREAGFDLQLTKPVDFDELESVLASHLAARSSAPG
jgi:CheY-like chemotaxis protein